MMMPANFSAIAENEMTYVVGGGIEAYLAPAMTAENWKTFNTNLITIVANQGMNDFLKMTLGTIFTGTYTPGSVLGKVGNQITGIWGNNVPTSNAKFGHYATGVLNVALYFVKGAATIYTLGHGSTKGAHVGGGYTWKNETIAE